MDEMNKGAEDLVVPSLAHGTIVGTPNKRVFRIRGFQLATHSKLSKIPEL